MNPSLTWGGIASVRRTEHYSLTFAALMQARGTPRFNIRLVSKDTHEHA